MLRLKNVRATYQRSMSTIFYDMISEIIDVYMDDIIVKTQDGERHLDDLRLVF